jgi:hypothetical protein
MVVASAMSDSSAAAAARDVTTLHANLARDGYLCEWRPRPSSRESWLRRVPTVYNYRAKIIILQNVFCRPSFDYPPW